MFPGPPYEMICLNCGNRFKSYDRIVNLTNISKKKVRCPKCGAKTNFNDVQITKK